MITEIDFKVKGEERKKLAYAIGELLGMSVKYTRNIMKLYTYFFTLVCEFQNFADLRLRILI